MPGNRTTAFFYWSLLYIKNKAARDFKLKLLRNNWSFSHVDNCNDHVIQWPIDPLLNTLFNY